MGPRSLCRGWAGLSRRASSLRTCDRRAPDALGLTDVLGRAISIAADCTLHRTEAEYESALPRLRSWIRASAR